MGRPRAPTPAVCTASRSCHRRARHRDHRTGQFRPHRIRDPYGPTLLALLAGGLAVIGSFYTARTFELNRAGHLTDRFTKAIEQLGHLTVDVRLGGIYALERIARDSKDDHPQVVEVLTAYVREHAPRTTATPDVLPGSVADADGSDTPARHRLDTDVQAALTVLGRRRLEHEQDGPVLDLANTELTGARLARLQLSGANLSKANLGKANLIRANLIRANLSWANLIGADLTWANLSGANLIRAHVSGAHLSWANLSGADLSGADLSGADLREADLRRADLSEADLRWAHLSGANLSEANLSGADLSGAHLSGANLTRAIHDSQTVWPDGFDPIGAVG